jgi:pilus assembly protein Flp/PilA
VELEPLPRDALIFPEDSAVWRADAIELPGPSRTGTADFEILEIPMLSIFRRLMKNAEGATAIEYTLIASLIAVAAIASMRTVGGKVSSVLSNVSSSMT